jgi:hypothetical protein
MTSASGDGSWWFSTVWCWRVDNSPVGERKNEGRSVIVQRRPVGMIGPRQITDGVRYGSAVTGADRGSLCDMARRTLFAR